MRTLDANGQCRNLAFKNASSESKRAVFSKFNSGGQVLWRDEEAARTQHRF
jgi:hypothetical protein